MGFVVLARPKPRLAVFAPPYREFTDIDPSWRPSTMPPRGLALIWWLADAERQETEFQWLHDRPPGLPLVVILPPAREITPALPLINYLSALHPRAVLPTGRVNEPAQVRQLLAAPPTDLARDLSRYLIHRGLLPTDDIQREVRKIIECAPEIASVSKLAKRLYTSRRTLGRHFARAGLPVPSHWLQITRLLHVVTALQSENTTVFRIATRVGYPDGFTMSNQMKRLIGHRPTEVRRRIGWEWVVEAWIRQELRSGAIDVERYRDALRPYLPGPTRKPSDTRSQTARPAGDGGNLSGLHRRSAAACIRDGGGHAGEQ